MKWHAKWIRPERDFGDVCPEYRKHFTVNNILRKALLHMTAQGTYVTQINGVRVSEYVLAPGWTSYNERLQYQTYDVTLILQKENDISITVGKGWYRSPISQDENYWMRPLIEGPAGVIAQLECIYEDGSVECMVTDHTWSVAESQVRFSEIYDGETLDATFIPDDMTPAVAFQGPSDTLISQEGEEIKEAEYITPMRLFTTPKGETVVDFGQNVTGYVQITVEAKAGEEIVLSHGEVLDKDGNFYNENYRSAKAQYCCICADGERCYKPLLTFYGFRYIRLDAFPSGAAAATAENFAAIAVHSVLKQTITFNCSHPKLNHLYNNILWGQRDNFLDVPTDCPQRNERLGWTGDAQVFVKTACYNYDVQRFFRKWLRDVQVAQLDNGEMPSIVPATFFGMTSAAWGDAATICPWTVFEMYGDKELLAEHFEMMRKWVDYITGSTKDACLWTGGDHYGDWLGLDAPSGSYKGSSRDDLIATAFYAYSTSLVVKAGKILDENVERYEKLYTDIVRAFRKKWHTYETQTECALAIHFRLAEDLQVTADRLVELIHVCGGHLETGFVGTPYLLHALSDFGHADVAYSLLLREEYPSWLYPVNHGATTMWEHWDSVMENGDFWSTDMNSFNHYAYGAVADWIYGKAAGIQPVEESPGFEKVRIAPQPDARLDWLQVTFDSRHGKIVSGWRKFEGVWRFEIETPVEAVIVIDGKTRTVSAGNYIFFAPIKN